jgi:hypothetical protein
MLLISKPTRILANHKPTIWELSPGGSNRNAEDGLERTIWQFALLQWSRARPSQES